MKTKYALRTLLTANCKLLTVLCTLVTVHCYAQTGILMNRYYITGSLSLGNNKAFADTSAWLQLGKDTTKRGLLLPRVILDSVITTKRGLYVYDLKDSVLYHIDGTKKVRYMTYKDTAFLASKLFVNTENAKDLKWADTAAMLNPYLRKIDTASLSNRISQKLNYTDTTAMLNPYLRKIDTTVMLSPYLRKIDTTSKWFIRTWTTDYLAEGTTNKYYTDARARSSISVSGSGLGYNGSTGVLTHTATLDNVLTNGNTSTNTATVSALTVDKTSAAAKLTLASDDNQQAIINFKQNSMHTTNRWDLGAAATSHDFSLYNYTTSTPGFTVAAANNTVSFTSGIKLGGYTGAYQTSAVLGMPNNTMMGWPLATSPGGNLTLNMNFDASNTFHIQYAGTDFYSYSAGTHALSGNDFYIIGSSAARIRIVGSTVVDQQVRFQDGTTTDMRVYRPANQTKMIIDKVISGVSTDLFSVDGSGNGVLAGGIKTVQPTANGAGLAKIGKIRTGSDTKKYLELDIDGTVYYILALTALP
jgi:hypothetical protein